MRHTNVNSSSWYLNNPHLNSNSLTSRLLQSNPANSGSRYNSDFFDTTHRPNTREHSVNRTPALPPGRLEKARSVARSFNNTVVSNRVAISNKHLINGKWQAVHDGIFTDGKVLTIRKFGPSTMHRIVQSYRTGWLKGRKHWVIMDFHHKDSLHTLLYKHLPHLLTSNEDFHPLSVSLIVPATVELDTIDSVQRRINNAVARIKSNRLDRTVRIQARVHALNVAPMAPSRIF